MGFLRASRRAALVSLFEGITYSGTGIVNTPVDLTGAVTAGPPPDDDVEGDRAWLTRITDSMAPRKLMWTKREVWHARIALAVESSATDAVADEVGDNIETALSNTTGDGTIHDIPQLSVDTFLDNGRLNIDVILTVEFHAPPGGY